MSPGADLSRQHIRQGIAAHVSCLAHEENCINPRGAADEAGVNHSPDVQHQHKLLIGGSQLLYGFLLLLEKLIVSRHGFPVPALPGVSGDNVDRRIRIGFKDVSFLHRTGSRLLKGTVKEHHDALRIPGCQSFPDSPIVIIPGPVHLFIVAVQPLIRGDHKPGIFQTFLCISGEAAVHIPGSGSPLDGMPGSGSVEGQLSPGGKGKGSVVFQKHHALGGDASGELHVSFFPFTYFRTGCCEYSGHFLHHPFFIP